MVLCVGGVVVYARRVGDGMRAVIMVAVVGVGGDVGVAFAYGVGRVACAASGRVGGIDSVAVGVVIL